MSSQARRHRPEARDHDAWLATLLHDLRTPLNGILGYSELLMEDAAAGGYEALLPALRQLSATSGELLALIQRTFDPTNPDAVAHSLEPAAIRAALRRALHLPAERLCHESEQLLATATANQPEALIADLQRIQAAAARFRELSGASTLMLPPTAAAPVSSGAARSPLVPSAILVVDDQAANRDLLARRLVREGHAVTVAEDGERALDLARAGQFDLVLLDVLMPGLDGYEVLQRLKADPATRDIPVIMVSALDEFASVVRCIELGAEDYLPKPFDPTLLRARLGASLEKKRWRDQERTYLATIEARDAELAEWNRTLEQRVQQQVEELERLDRLRRFLSPQLAELIVASGDESLLASHRREITVICCGLRGFTAFAETAQPEDVIGVLGDYHAALGPLIFEYAGTLERFAGDRMVVFFNDPVPCPEPVWRAVQLATALRDRAAELSQRWRRRGHELDLAVGVAVGYATCGRIGFAGRFDYAAIGTVTTLAARLCDRALAGQILVSARAHADVEGRIVAEPAGELAVNEFGRPAPIFNVTRPAPAPGAAHPAGLSAREVEVLRLVAEGLTDAQVAERLFLSRRTVNQHLRSVYNKLGVSTRAAATRFAIEHQLA